MEISFTLRRGHMECLLMFNTMLNKSTHFYLKFNSPKLLMFSFLLDGFIMMSAYDRVKGLFLSALLQPEKITLTFVISHTFSVTIPMEGFHLEYFQKFALFGVQEV